MTTERLKKLREERRKNKIKRVEFAVHEDDVPILREFVVKLNRERRDD